MATKTCNLCNRDLPLECYYRTREGTPYGPCRDCRSESASARYVERKQRVAEQFGRLVSP